MRIIENKIKFCIEEPTAVAIGKFDGFHMGHQKLLRKLAEQKNRGLKTAVFTFVPSPAAFFGGDRLKDLSTAVEKRRVFEKAGVDYLIEFPFFRETADMEPETFISDVLAGMIHACCIVAGEDVSYGRNGAGDAALLKEMSVKYGYDVKLIEKVLYEGREVSSTYVRKAVRDGNMELAKKLLGMPYHISGEIVHGRQLGRTLGMPTVNLIPPKEKLLPPNGVYYSYVYLNETDKNRGIQYPAITNIGTKPTVDNCEQMGVETYLYDFSKDVYGEMMEVYLLEYKRPEMCFDGVEKLKIQMCRDIEEGRYYHGLI